MAPVNKGEQFVYGIGDAVVGVIPNTAWQAFNDSRSFQLVSNVQDHQGRIITERMDDQMVEGTVDFIPKSSATIPELGDEVEIDEVTYWVISCDKKRGSKVCAKADAILIESVDGRPHLEQARIAIMAGKPLYIDKPLAGSLRDALEIIKLAQEKKVPLFTSSSLRFAKNTQSVRNGLIGKITEASTTSPCHLEPHHPDLYWYGIHGCESLFTIMGTGCETVTRTTTPEGLIAVTGLWKGGRKGTFTEGKTYSGLAQGEKGTAPIGSFDGYAPLVVEIVKFFKTGQSLVPIEETIELLAFMEAADESKRQNGAPVSLEFVLEKARKPLP